MTKPLALIIQSSDAATTSIAKVAEARDCSIHVSRSIEEAKRMLAAFPTEQLKYVFADLALCQGPGWNELTDQLRQNPDHMALDLLRSRACANALRPAWPVEQEPIRNLRSPLHCRAANDGSHWSYLLDTDGALEYGNDWKANADGTFTSVSAPKYYSSLDLYLMGMIDKTQVPAMTLIENAAIDPAKLPEPGVTITGTSKTITIDDIIAAEGQRVPNATASPKTIKTGFIFITHRARLPEPNRL